MNTEPETEPTPRVVFVVFSMPVKGANTGLAYWGETEEIARQYGEPVVRVELPA